MLLYTLSVPRTHSDLALKLPVIQAQTPPIGTEVLAVGLFFSAAGTESFENTFCGNSTRQVSVGSKYSTESKIPLKFGDDTRHINYLVGSIFKESASSHNTRRVPSIDPEFYRALAASPAKPPSISTTQVCVKKEKTCDAELDKVQLRMSSLSVGSSSSDGLSGTPVLHDAFGDISHNRFTRNLVKLRCNDSFYYLLETGTTLIDSPPADASHAKIGDIFVHRVVPQPDSTLGRRVQMWILGGDGSWEPAMVGKVRVLKGDKRYLGVDIDTGRPFWYSSSTFAKYIARERKRLADSEA